jgi:hypothetical protein
MVIYVHTKIPSISQNFDILKKTTTTILGIFEAVSFNPLKIFNEISFSVLALLEINSVI